MIDLLTLCRTFQQKSHALHAAAFRDIPILEVSLAYDRRKLDEDGWDTPDADEVQEDVETLAHLRQSLLTLPEEIVALRARINALTFDDLDCLRNVEGFKTMLILPEPAYAAKPAIWLSDLGSLKRVLIQFAEVSGGPVSVFVWVKNDYLLRTFPDFMLHAAPSGALDVTAAPGGYSPYSSDPEGMANGAAQALKYQSQFYKSLTPYSEN